MIASSCYDVFMRTTLVLDDDVYDAVRRRAFDERRSLGAVVSELVHRALDAEPRQQRPIGIYDGQGWMADDFNETPGEVLEALEAPLS